MDRQTDRQTDGQTTCSLNTALCTIVHHMVKIISKLHELAVLKWLCNNRSILGEIFVDISILAQLLWFLIHTMGNITTQTGSTCMFKHMIHIIEILRQTYGY